MPGGHTRNAVLAYCTGTRVDHARRGTDEPRLISEDMGTFDAICFVADDKPGLDAVKAIHGRKHTTPARTIARRRETVQRAQEAADVQGWTLTADERTMLEGFAPGDA